MTMNDDSTASISLGELRFSWRDWDPRALGAEIEWTHPGLAVLPGGDIVVPDQTTRELVRLGPDGREVKRVALDATNAHGLTATADGQVWVADTGMHVKVEKGEVIKADTPGSVFSVGLDGQPGLSLRRPDHPGYVGGPYLPTSVAVADAGSGGSGDIWVADGYGMALVHRYDASGEYLLTLDGEEGGGRFDRAHCVFVDWRGAEPRLLVTDRSNHRIGVYDLEGTFIKLLGVGELRMPSAFAVAGDLLYVAELWSRLAVYDPDDRLIGYLGDGELAWEEEAWPNVQTEDGVVRRPVQPGRFNAPHGFDAGPDGTLYVAEWSLGGRIVELAPTTG